MARALVKRKYLMVIVAASACDARRFSSAVAS
jgi:hypothetical protein